MDIAKPLKCQAHIGQVGDDLVLRWRVGSFAMGAAFLLLLTGCTAACVVWTGELIRAPTVEHVLFCLPFWSLWVCVAYLMAWVSFGSEELRIGPDGVEYHCRVVIGLGRRRVPLEEVRAVALSRSGRSSTEHALKIEAWGRPIRFGQPIDLADGLRLAERIHRHLQGLSPGRVIGLRTDEAARESMQVEILRSEGKACEPPSDSEIQLHQDPGRTKFIGRRTFRLAEFISVALLSIIVNGFLAFAVYNVIRRPQDWFVLLIMIPWEIAGFVTIMIWLSVWADQLQERTWTVGPGELTARTSFFGIGRTWHHDLSNIDRIELRRASIVEERKRSWNGQESDTPFALVLVGQAGRDRLVIGDLTEGEARWMGGRLSESLTGSLPNDTVPR